MKSLIRVLTVSILILCMVLLLSADLAVKQIINNIQDNMLKIKTLQMDYILKNKLNNNPETVIKGKIYIKGEKTRLEISEPVILKTTILKINGKQYTPGVDNLSVKDLEDNERKEALEKKIQDEAEKITGKRPKVKIKQNKIETTDAFDIINMAKEFNYQQLKIKSATASECIIEAQPVIEGDLSFYKELLIDLNTGNIIKIIYYTTAGKKFQESTYEYIYINNIWLVSKITVLKENAQMNYKLFSEIVLKNITVNTELSDSLFIVPVEDK